MFSIQADMTIIRIILHRTTMLLKSNICQKDSDIPFKTLLDFELIRFNIFDTIRNHIAVI